MTSLSKLTVCYVRVRVIDMMFVQEQLVLMRSSCDHRMVSDHDDPVRLARRQHRRAHAAQSSTCSRVRMHLTVELSSVSLSHSSCSSTTAARFSPGPDQLAA